jgi:hypothetical protein
MGAEPIAQRLSARFDLAAALPTGYAATMSRAHSIGFVLLAAACSNPQPSPSASSSLAVSSTPAASANVAAPAVASAAPATETAEVPGGMKLDPGWVTEEPKIGEVLRLARPICNLQEDIRLEYGSADAYTKTYSANAPTRSTETLQRELAGEAKRLGIPLVTGSAEHPVFGVEATGTSTFVVGTSVVVSVRGRGQLRDEVIALARRRQLASLEILEAVGLEARVRELEVQRSGSGGVTATWVVDVPPSAGKAVDAWAKKNGVAKIEGGWLRTVDDKDTSKPAFVVDLAGKELSITETRGPQIGGPACASAPAPPAPPSSGSAKKPSKAEEDALFHEIMGE